MFVGPDNSFLSFLESVIVALQGNPSRVKSFTSLMEPSGFDRLNGLVQFVDS
jgi:hypothetical protein